MWVEFEGDDGQLVVRQARLGFPAARHLSLHQPPGTEGAVDHRRRAGRPVPRRPRSPGRGRAADRPCRVEHDGEDGRPLRRGARAAAAGALRSGSPAAMRSTAVPGKGLTRDGVIGALIIGDEILSGKRQDKHLAHVIETLATRGLDARLCALPRRRSRAADRVAARLRSRTATSCSRSAASARRPTTTRGRRPRRRSGVPLVRHPEAVAEIEQRFGAEAYPQSRADGGVPRGRDDHSEPGQQRRRVLDPRPPFLSRVSADGLADARLGARDVLSGPRREPAVERAMLVHDAGESQLLAVMNDNVARFPRVQLFSLPSFVADGSRRLELGVRGPRDEVDRAFEHLRAGVGPRASPSSPSSPAPDDDEADERARRQRRALRRRARRRHLREHDDRHRDAPRAGCGAASATSIRTTSARPTRAVRATAGASCTA